jgi:hypothetical protein
VRWKPPVGSLSSAGALSEPGLIPTEISTARACSGLMGGKGGRGGMEEKNRCVMEVC